MTNVDVAIVINREIDNTQGEDGPQYFGFNLQKFRGKPNKDKLYVFLHPFDENNPILLIPDIDGKPLSKLSIEDFNPLSSQRKNAIQQMSEADKATNGFLDFCSSLGEDYEDSFETMADICKSADDVVATRMKLLEDKERELRQQRKMEMRNLTLPKVNGYFVIHSRKPQNTTTEYVAIHRINKVMG